MKANSTYPLMVKLIGRNPYGREELHGKVVPARSINLDSKLQSSLPTIEVKGEFLSSDSHYFAPEHHYSFFKCEYSVVTE